MTHFSSPRRCLVKEGGISFTGRAPMGFLACNFETLTAPKSPDPAVVDPVDQASIPLPPPPEGGRSG